MSGARRSFGPVLLGLVDELGPDKWQAGWHDADGVEWTKEFVTERDAVMHLVEKAPGGPGFTTSATHTRHGFSDGLPVNVVQRVMGHEAPSTTLNLYTHAPSKLRGPGEGRVRG
jgi:hypothetical protein